MQVLWDAKMLYQCTNPLIPWPFKKFFPSKKIVVFGFLKSAELLQIPVNVNKEEIQIKVSSSKFFLNCLVPYVHSGSQESF